MLSRISLWLWGQRAHRSYIGRDSDLPSLSSVLPYIMSAPSASPEQNIRMCLVKTRAIQKHLENSDMEVPGQLPFPHLSFPFVLEIFLHLSWLGFKVSLGWVRPSCSI